MAHHFFSGSFIGRAEQISRKGGFFAYTGIRWCSVFSCLLDREKNDGIKKLHTLAVKAENDFTSSDDDSSFDDLIQKERDESWRYGGKTVFSDAKKPRKIKRGVQLRLF